MNDQTKFMEEIKDMIEAFDRNLPSFRRGCESPLEYGEKMMHASSHALGEAIELAQNPMMGIWDVESIAIIRQLARRYLLAALFMHELAQTILESIQ